MCLELCEGGGVGRYSWKWVWRVEDLDVFMNERTLSGAWPWASRGQADEGEKDVSCVICHRDEPHLV